MNSSLTICEKTVHCEDCHNNTLFDMPTGSIQMCCIQKTEQQYTELRTIVYITQNNSIQKSNNSIQKSKQQYTELRTIVYSTQNNSIQNSEQQFTTYKTQNNSIQNSEQQYTELRTIVYRSQNNSIQTDEIFIQALKEDVFCLHFSSNLGNLVLLAN